jgi:hypothetical protein
MAKVKRSTRGLSASDRTEKSGKHLRMLTGNPNFPTAATWLPPYQTAHDELSAAIGDSASKRAAYHASVVRVRQAIKRWDKEHGLLASRVEAESDGEPVKLVTGGFELHGRRNVAHLLPAPESFHATFGDREGAIDLSWDPVKGARGFVIQMTTSPNRDDWQQVLVSTRSSCTIKNLVSGTAYWFRVAALNSAGTGAYSNPVQKMAP